MQALEALLLELDHHRAGRAKGSRRTRESLHRYHNARIKIFVPVLVHRDVREAVLSELRHRQVRLVELDCLECRVREHSFPLPRSHLRVRK